MAERDEGGYPPCPCCGSCSVVARYVWIDDNGDDGVAIECQNCGCRGSIAKYAMPGSDGYSVASNMKLVEAAKAAWLAMSRREERR